MQTGYPTATAGSVAGDNVDVSGHAAVGYGKWHSGVSVDWYIAAIMLGALIFLFLLSFYFKGARI